jgi:glutamine synthetase
MFIIPICGLFSARCNKEQRPTTKLKSVPPLTMLASSAAVKALSRRALSRTAIGGVRGMANLEAYDEFGKSVFAGKVANEYLQKHGASGEILKDATWVKTHADVVANAVFDW